MKIKKLIKMLECIEGEYYAYGHSGRLPSDMYELGYYTSSDENGADTDINMEDMDFVHFVRAFKKMQKTLAEEVRRDTQEGKVAELEQEVARLKRRNDKYYEDYDHGLQLSVTQTNQIMKLEQKVSHLLSRNKYLQERIEELTPNRQSPVYTFSEIPNDCKGQEFTDNLKKYLNKDRFKMRARGQYLDKSKLSEGESWKTYDRGQPIDKSTHIRVYLDKK
jgi:hypothetical protein